MSTSDSEQYNLLDQLAEEFAARFRRGERPALKEYTDRYRSSLKRSASSSRRWSKWNKSTRARSIAKVN
jgi:hypothetical protein